MNYQDKTCIHVPSEPIVSATFDLVFIFIFKISCLFALQVLEREIFCLLAHSIQVSHVGDSAHVLEPL